MVEHEIVVGLIVECLAPSSPWGEPIWRPVQVLQGAPDARAWTVLGRETDRVRYYAGAFPVTLYSTETAFYRDNLAADRPRLWVGMRPEGCEPPVGILAVTANPTEGEGMTETGTNLVEVIDMPDWIAAEIAAFIDTHHVERTFIKRKRDKQPLDKSRRGPPGENKS